MKFQILWKAYKGKINWLIWKRDKYPLFDDFRYDTMSKIYYEIWYLMRINFT